MVGRLLAVDRTMTLYTGNNLFMELGFPENSLEFYVVREFTRNGAPFGALIILVSAELAPGPRDGTSRLASIRRIRAGTALAARGLPGGVERASGPGALRAPLHFCTTTFCLPGNANNRPTERKWRNRYWSSIIHNYLDVPCSRAARLPALRALAPRRESEPRAQATFSVALSRPTNCQVELASSCYSDHREPVFRD